MPIRVPGLRRSLIAVLLTVPAVWALGGSAVQSTAFDTDQSKLTVIATSSQKTSESSLLTLDPAASFVNLDPLRTHRAEIDWGDGTIQGAAVSESGGAGKVTGSHTYAETGSYTLKVTVTEIVFTIGEGTVIIDGAEDSGEWNNATRFEVFGGIQGGTLFAVLVMKDDTNLYFGLGVPDDTLSPDDAVEIRFDNDSNGLVDDRDDELRLQGKVDPEIRTGS